MFFSLKYMGVSKSQSGWSQSLLPFSPFIIYVYGRAKIETKQKKTIHPHPVGAFTDASNFNSLVV